MPTALLAQDWHLQNPAAKPSARDGSSMVYDPVHHQTVLFGGEDGSGTPLGDTWFYDGTNWTQLNPSAAHPSARLWAGMAFDVAHGSVILFGGCPNAACSPGYLGDTWHWDGSNWITANLSTSPSPRRAPAMAYAATASNPGVILFGGSDSPGTALSEMWIWGANGWHALAGLPLPGAREFGSMSYDPINAQIVMYGGQVGSGLLSDTELWDGNSWSQGPASPSPGQRTAHGQVYDPVRQKTVLFGGDAALKDTWLWDGAAFAWTQDSPPNTPGSRLFSNLAYDTQHANAVLFGGPVPSGQASTTDVSVTWKLGFQYSAGWMELQSVSGAIPPAVVNGAAATDGFNAYLFGGMDSSNVLHNQMYLWTGIEYGTASNGTPPSPRENTAMAYSPQDHSLVLFGGGTGSGNTGNGETWLFNTNTYTWSQPELSLVPNPRFGHTMSYDAVNKDIVLFGGYVNGTLPQETWLWQNSQWIHADPANSPGGRQNASQVYDAARSQTTLFGGLANGVAQNDTWIWNGGNWSSPTLAVNPPARFGASMFYDSTHGTVLLFGGQDALGERNDMWQWDGVSWTELPTIVPAPDPVSGAASTYIPAAQQFYLYGGACCNGEGIVGLTWMYASPYTSSILTTGFSGQPYSDTLSILGGSGSNTLTDLGIPQSFSAYGLALSSVGVVSGTDTASSGTSTAIGVRITDSQRQSTVVPLTLITDNTIGFAPNPPQDATAGKTYTYPLSATGGSGGFTFSINTSTLPWLRVDSSGNLTGTCPSGPSTGTYSLTAVDSVAGTAQAGPFTLNCNPAPHITNSGTLPTAMVGTSYSVQLTTNATYDAPGASPYQWSADPTTIPPGLSVNSSGQVTGTPTVSSSTPYVFNVTFTDAWSATITKAFTITVIPQLLITTAQLPTGNVGFGYPAGQAIAATGGTGGYTFSVSNFPDGLLFNTANGAITGSPTTVKTYNTSFTVTDSADNQVSVNVPMYVVAPGTNPEDWAPLSPVFSPEARYNGSMFYDSARGKTILFGGGGLDTLNDTEAWDGTNWTTLYNSYPPANPSPRTGAAVAFDPVHQQGVMFGGQDSGFNLLQDTNLWTGTAWTQSPATPPPLLSPRFNAMMAWDGHHIVMFGGTSGEGEGQFELGDTWIWDGSAWTQITTAVSPHAPAARDSAAMTYDPVRNQVVLFGGYDIGTNTDFPDTWIWDGGKQTWTQAHPANSPGARDTASMVFDTVRGEAVLFGGYSVIGGAYRQDTWTWNGTDWTPLTTLHAPSPRNYYSMVFDTAHSNIVLFGGTSPSGSSFYENDTWILEGPSVTSSVTLPAGTLGIPYSNTPTEVAGVAPLTFTDTSAPSWLSINSTNGGLSGTPTATGTFPFNYIVIDNWGVSSTADLTLTVNPPAVPLSIQPTTLPDATAGANYSVQLSATGGVQPYFFSESGLEAIGLQINTNNQIVGQCTASSTNIMLSVSDSAEESVSVGPLTVNCNAAPSITTTSPLPGGFLNTPYSTAIQLTGGTPLITWSITAGALPTGFQLSNTGVITGSSTTPLFAQFSVTATDIWKAFSTVQYTLHVESVMTITSTSLPNGVQNSPYPNGVTLAVSGGTGSTTYAFSATGLPLGMQIDPSTGTIGGTPLVAGIFQPTFTVTDQTPQTVNLVIPMQILPSGGNPNWTNLNLSNGPAARDSYAMAYDSVHAVTVFYGGNAGAGDTWTFAFPSTWTHLNPSQSPVAQLGTAMAMAPQGGIVLFGGQTGTTVSNQTYSWDGAQWTLANPLTSPTARSYHGMAPDSAHNSVVMFGGSPTGAFAQAISETWLWNDANWTKQTPSTVPTAATNVSLADGPTGPVLFGGIDQSGNPLNQTWVWDGSNWNLQHPIISPAARSGAGMVYDSQNRVTKLFGGLADSGELQDTWQWDGRQWLEVNPAVMPPTRVNVGLSFDSGFNQTIVFGGESLNAPGLDYGDTWTLGFPVITNLTLPAETAGAQYSATLPVIGGTPPYQYQATGSPQSLPDGLNLNVNTGQITGATQLVGTYLVGIALGDSQIGISTSQQNVSITVSPAGTLILSPTTLPDATASTNYNVQLSATGGVQPYHFSAGSLPAGLQLNSGNQIAGQCTAGAGNVFIAVTDSAQPLANSSGASDLTVNCNALPSITTPQTLTSGVVGTAYSATLQMTGGTAPIVWSLGTNNLPLGYGLTSAGLFTGPATAPVSAATFTAIVTDRWGATANQTFTLNIYPVLTITTSSLPNGTAGVTYQGGVTIVPGGGTGTNTYGFSATDLPNGFSIDPSSGLISGNTTQTGLFTPNFKVTDHDAQIANKQIDLTILNGSGITILSPTLLTAGATGQQYNYQLQWTGGVAPTGVSSSALPGWLTLTASTGALSGMPPAGGAYMFPITVTDSQSPTANTASQTETIVVNPPSITTASPLPSATIGLAYSQNLAASGGQPGSGYTWASSNLPSWLSLSTGGALTGTPPVNTPSSVSFDVTVTDSLGAFISGNFTLPVQPTPGLLFQTTSPLPAGTPNVPYSTTVQVLGGNGVFTLSPTGLPGWLQFDPKTNALSGTPPSAGPVTFQLTLSDNVKQSLSQYFTLPVNAALTFGSASPLPPATVGVQYSETLAASGGSGSYTWSATGLPSWLSLSPSGGLSGNPSSAGPISFQVTVRETGGNSIDGTFTLQVHASLTVDTASPLLPATLNFPYLANFAASGGGGNYQWSATDLPSGFTLSPAGVLLGTPQSTAPIVFNVTVVDSADNSLSQSFTLPVNANLTINNQSPLTEGDPQIAYSANFTASGGIPGYTWSATGMPSWLNLTEAGYLSGTPPANAAAVNFQVTLADSANHSVTVPFILPMYGSLTIATATLPVATVNVAYSTPLAATGGNGTYTWSATGLPTGMTISAAGVLSGSVSVPGPYPFQIAVKDSATATASQNFTLLVSTGLPLSFVTQSLSPCVANTSCPSQIMAAGGIPPYTFSVSPTANLGGLTLSANGSITGTPTSGGAIGIPVILTDQVTSIVETLTQTVIPNIVITPTSLPNGTVGLRYSASLNATGGQGPYTWSLANGSSLPPGLSIDPPSGNISGTPTSAGTFTFWVQESDLYQTSPPQQFSIAIASASTVLPLTVVSPSMLASGTVGTAYSQTLAATGGSGQYTWSLFSGALPAGLALASNGAIAGTPTGAQTANFTVTLSDGTNSLSPGFTIVVTSPTSVALLTPNPLPDGAVGVQYNYGLVVTGGTPPYLYSITAGDVPPGLTFDATNGTFSGTPTQKGAFGVVLTVADSGGTPPVGTTAKVSAKDSARVSVTSNYTIQIAGTGDFQITTPENLPNGTLGQGYSTTLAVSGGQSPYQWQLLDGTLPSGLALLGAGTITGTPTQSGTASLVIKVSDTTGATATGAFLLRIANPNVPAIDPFPPFPPGTVGQSYQAGPGAIGGHTPYTWSISAGSLPPGLSLNPQTGAIDGTPTTSGNFPFTEEVTDSQQVPATHDFAIRVDALTLQITPTTIPIGTANIPYSFGLNVSGGVSPYTWSLSAGGLLTGFAIDPSSGTITGTPTVPGAYRFTISVIDSNYGVAAQNYQFTVQGPSLAIATTSVPSTTVGASYDYGLLASNATPPLTWSIASGTLPPGIQLQGSGTLAGTATAAGSYTFTAQVSDATTATAKATFTLVVKPQPLTIVTTSLPRGTIGIAYSQTLQSSGGTGAIAWSLTSGTLPTGLSLSAAGTISGSPGTLGAIGVFPFTVKATDSTGVTAQQPLSLTVASPPAVPAITLSGLPATSKPGDQPVVTITLASPYPLPIYVSATLSITPNPGNSTDLVFPDGLRITQILIQPNTTTATIGFQTGTLPGTIQLSLTLTTSDVDITPPVPLTATTVISAAVPAISSVKVSTTSGFQVIVAGTSTTLDMKTATFQFTPAAGANLQTTSVSIDVSSLFAAWYQNPKSLATGSQFSLTMPFTISGKVSDIASVTVTLTNSVGASAPASANVP